MAIFMIVLFGFLGGSIASFLGVLAERPLRGESLLPGSHCACGRALKITENIPVIGWVFSSGKASCCGSILPKRYIFSELALFGVFSVFGWLFYLFLIQETKIESLWIYILFMCLSSIITFRILKQYSKNDLNTTHDKTI